MVCFLDMFTAPLARDDIMITGSISGMMPTAMVTPNISDSSQFPLVIKLAIKMMGTMITMNRIRSLLMELTFCS